MSEQTSNELVVAGLGELVDLGNPDQCAAALAGVQRLEAQLREAKATLKSVLIEEAARQGTRTLRSGPYQVTVKPRRETAWDLETLGQLRQLGLPEERWNALVTETVEQKVSVREADRIAKANPEYAAVIRSAREDTEREPTVEIQ